MIAIILLIIVILCIILILYIRSKLSKFSSIWFGTSNFMEGLKILKDKKEQLDAEEKTPFGMDSLLLPEISKDFPNMNIEEMKKLSEEKVIDYLKKQKDKTYEDIIIHKTVVNQYSKNGSTCKLIFQTSVGFRVSYKDESHIKEVRMNTEFMYVYDNSKLSGEAISLNCPNCGAPIKGLGHKICPYCKTGLIDLATKTWKVKKVSII